MSMAPRKEAATASSSPSPSAAPQPIANAAHGNGVALDGDGHGSVVVSAPAHSAYDALNSAELYLNRELTWLAFNERVLAEAEDDTNPLLERVKFLAIGCATIDEFFMKRIGGLKHQVVAGVHELTPDGRTPQQQIAECYERLREIEARQRKQQQQLQYQAGPAQAEAPKPVRAGAKVGRNDPCPCGSGKKYKKCHGINA